ncbi:MAG: hypothetical protein ACLTT1_08305 [[Clostridium] scindens]
MAEQNFTYESVFRFLADQTWQGLPVMKMDQVGELCHWPWD